MQTCIRCGEGIPQGATTCPRCGAEVLQVTPPLPLERLRHPLENPVFVVLAVAGAITWLLLLVVTLGIIIPVGVVLWFFMWVAFQMFRAQLLTHSVRVSEQHFPHVHRAFEEVRQQLGYREPLEIYIMEGTALNAFVAMMMRSRCMVLFSQLVEGIEEDPAALRGLLGHELAHFVLGHFRWRWLVMGGFWIPPLYLAWSRLCEYSADRCGQACAGDLQAYERVLAMLATGWRLARHVQPELLVQQANEAQTSIFARLIEITSTHPPLVKRVAELRQFVLGTPQITVERRAATTLGAVMLLPFAGLQGLGSSAAAALGVLVLAVLAAILLPVFEAAREEARMQACMSNMKQLSRAIKMYTEDYDGRLPVFGIQALVGTYLQPGAEVLRCPSDDTPQPISYALNRDFAGWILSRIETPERTVLLYEGDDEDLIMRHKDGLNIVCADGQVRWIKETSIDEYFWEPR
jgi:Zn-dependent protease with chaperone function